MRYINKRLISSIFGVVALSLSTACYSLELSQVGQWGTRNELPKVTQAISSVLSQPDLNQTQRDALTNLKNQVAELQAAEQKIDTTLAEWNRVNAELSKIQVTGVNASGQRFTSSGHLTATGATNPIWAKVQADQQQANAEAVDTRNKVKTTINALDPDLQTKLASILR